MSNSISISISINGGAPQVFELNEANCKVTRTFIGYKVTATVMHLNNGVPELVNRTAYIDGTSIKEADIKRAFAPDSVGAILSTEKVSELRGESPELFRFASLVLPDRPEYPSVKARREARESK